MSHPDQCPFSKVLQTTDQMQKIQETNVLCYISSFGGDKEALQKCCNTTTEVFVTGADGGYDECHFSVACGEPEDKDDFQRIADVAGTCYKDAGGDDLACMSAGRYKGEEPKGAATTLRLSNFGGLLLSMAVVASVDAAL